MAATSRFFFLDRGLLLEYSYTDQSSPEEYSTSTVGYELVSNGYTGINYTYFQDDQEAINPNVKNNTAVLLNDSTRYWGYLDTDIVLNYLDFDSQLTDTASSPISFSPDVNIKVDTVKIHIAAGYDFGENEGFIFELQARQRSGLLHNLASLVYLKSSSYTTINPKPLLLSDTLYTRYIEFKVPSTYYVVQDFEAAPSNTNLLSYKLTGGQGLTPNNPIYVKLHFINKITQDNGFQFFNTNLENNYTINQVDDFSILSASIVESTAGDYYEISPQVTGQTVENYIGFLNTQPNSDWILIHEIELVELAGTSFITTAELNFIQDTNFGDPLRYRPVVLNSNAKSYTINYNLRLFNRIDNSQVFKVASLTDNNVTKYGRFLDRIDLGTVPAIDKIYNINTTTDLVSVDIGTNAETSTRYIANYLDRLNISTSISNELVNSLEGFQTGDLISSENDIYKPGEGTIVVRPYDNYIKFTLYRPNNEQYVNIDLTELGVITLDFIDNSGNKNSFLSIVDDTVFPSQGEILFLISETEARDILLYGDRSFNLVLKNDNSISTSIYTGQFITYTEFINDNILRRTDEYKSTIAQRNNTINDLNDNVNSLEDQIQTLQSDNFSLSEQIANLQAQIVALQQGSNITDLTSTTPAQRAAAEKTNSSVKTITNENATNDNSTFTSTVTGLTIKKFNP